MAKTYRTGIIGCGGMGRAHSTAYTKIQRQNWLRQWM